MISFQTIVSELNAIKALQSIKVSVFQVIIYSTIVVGVGFIYVVGKPLYKNINKIPEIQKQVSELDVKINDVSKNSNTSYTDTIIPKLSNRLDRIDRNINIILLQQKIIKQEFPKLRQRFDDVESGWDSQFEDLKKNDMCRSVVD